VGKSSEPKSLSRRERIFLRDGHRCVYCGALFPAADLTVDHVEPRRKGGDQSDGNLVTSCRPCNRAKGGEPAWSYLARHPELRASFLARAENVWPRLRRAIEEAAGQ
jgi:5-methylcytosine-specific restriction endonuclease McrA